MQLGRGKYGCCYSPRLDPRANRIFMSTSGEAKSAQEKPPNPFNDPLLQVAYSRTIVRFEHRYADWLKYQNRCRIWSTTLKFSFGQHLGRWCSLIIRV